MHLRIHRQFYQYIKGWKPVTPLEAVPGLVLLLVCTLVGCIIYELINKVSPKNLPGNRLYLIYRDPDHDPGCQPDRRLCDRTDWKDRTSSALHSDPCICRNLHRKRCGYI